MFYLWNKSVGEKHDGEDAEAKVELGIKSIRQCQQKYKNWLATHCSTVAVLGRTTDKQLRF